MRLGATGLALLLAGSAAAQPRPSAPRMPDAETRAWWALTRQLSSDAMEGRDTGSAGYDRAAAVVVARLRRAGLRPAGDGGTYLQHIPLKEVRVESEGLGVRSVERPVAPNEISVGRLVIGRLPFLTDWTIRPAEQLPAQFGGRLAFRGTCGTDALSDVRGKVVMCLNTRRRGAPTGGQQVQAAAAAGAIALIQVDNPLFTVEPPRWPVAYARSVTFPDAPAPTFSTLPVIRMSPTSAAGLIAGQGRSATDLFAAADRGESVPSFDPLWTLGGRLTVTTRALSSPNIVAILPGTDPALADQYVVVGAHLDGYGYGEPVDGDRLYNGAFDDAAYVATLVRMVEQRRGRGFRRPVIVAAFTGEEKGLLGSRWLVDHLPVPREQVVAMINLDQLRPIFPLDLLTIHAREDSTVGDDARSVAETMGIRTRLDPEPERGLLMRSDHWPFLQAGVPAVNFVFGYEPGTEAERRYRAWYRTRYHAPQDDVSQPWDPEAARKFNAFFYALVERVADADRRPAFHGDNPYAAR